MIAKKRRPICQYDLVALGDGEPTYFIPRAPTDGVVQTRHADGPPPEARVVTRARFLAHCRF